MIKMFNYILVKFHYTTKNNAILTNKGLRNRFAYQCSSNFKHVLFVTHINDTN